MDNLSREGHRKRLRELYANGGNESMPDYLLLELLLTYAIPRRDVKEIAFNLMNKFSSLDRLFNASNKELQEVEGVGEYTATLITLVNVMKKRIDINKNENMISIKCVEDTKKYFRNRLINEPVEVLLVLTLDNDLRIINCHEIARGTVNSSSLNIRQVFETIFLDKASAIILAHNHPNGRADPSAQDINTTLKILEVSRSLSIHFIDHVIVGHNETKSLRTLEKYVHFFD